MSHVPRFTWANTRSAISRRVGAVVAAVAISGSAPVVLLAISAGPALGQGVGLPGQNRKIPLEIVADDGIEWRKEAKVYIARGKARAKQGDVAVHADVLKAYYRNTTGGGAQIWRIDGDGDVRIVSPTQTAYGDKAVYDVTQGVLVLTGKVRMVTKTDKIVARDSLEYWEKRGLVVARGNAVASRGDTRLRADILTARFETGKNGKTRMTRIDAFDNVLVSTASEIATGNQGVYNVETGIAVLSGSVKITRGKNQLRGAYAEINLNTGVSRLFGGGNQGVTGYLAPQELKKQVKPRRGKAATSNGRGSTAR
jgi:lipopolysaccharide export system protein LptA